jgi:hypothetical protein
MSGREAMDAEQRANREFLEQLPRLRRRGIIVSALTAYARELTSTTKRVEVERRGHLVYQEVDERFHCWSRPQLEAADELERTLAASVTLLFGDVDRDKVRGDDVRMFFNGQSTHAGHFDRTTGPAALGVRTTFMLEANPLALSSPMSIERFRQIVEEDCREVEQRLLRGAVVVVPARRRTPGGELYHNLCAGSGGLEHRDDLLL